MISGTEFVLCIIFGALCGIGAMLFDMVCTITERKEENV